MAKNVIPFPTLDETARKTALYKWADEILKELGLIDQIEQANSVEALRKIIFDVDTVEAELAIQEALHPESGHAAAHFDGLTKRPLKNLLKARFSGAKKLRMHAIGRGEFYTGPSGKSSTYDWTEDLVLSDKGAILLLLVNLILFLRHHKKWQNVFAFDEFSNRVVVRKASPAGSDGALTDQHESKVRSWFQREGIKAGQGDVGRAVQAAARDNSFHPVRSYFGKLVWDGTPRIDSWLQTYLHVEDSAYVRAVGPRFLISGVARIDQPGCKVDHSLILEGPQGKLKSETLRALAIEDAYFTDRLSHIASRDAAMEIAGILLVEVAEMDALIKASSSAGKSFLTRRFNRFRPPWGRHPINQPRQCIFAGTINPSSGGYLKDPTGARRFWPVLCQGMIDLDGIKRDRDQLWAEAVVRYKAGAKWWLETPELEALATAEQALRFKTDAWQERVEAWLGDRKETGVSEVLEGALGIPPREQTRSAEMRIASMLTHLGFARCRPNKDGDRRRRYRRE